MGYGMFSNATAQYKSIEKKLTDAQNKRDGLLNQVTILNSQLEEKKFQIENILASYEFRNGLVDPSFLDSQAYNTLGKPTKKTNQLEIEKGLRFDAKDGTLKTSIGSPIADAVAFLDWKKLGYNKFTLPTGTQKECLAGNTEDTCYQTGSSNPTNYTNPDWKNIKKLLLDSLVAYKGILNNIKIKSLELNTINTNINNLKKELETAAANDPTLLKAKAEADARDREAKLKADQELATLKATQEASLREQQLAMKERQRKLLLIVGGGVAVLGLALILKK